MKSKALNALSPKWVLNPTQGPIRNRKWRATTENLNKENERSVKRNKTKKLLALQGKFHWQSDCRRLQERRGSSEIIIALLEAGTPAEAIARDKGYPLSQVLAVSDVLKRRKSL